MGDSKYVTLAANENQALGIGRFAVDFMAGKLGQPADDVFERVEQFHLDSIACAVSAIALGTNAPNVLRAEAGEYPRSRADGGVPLLGTSTDVSPEKAVLANSSAAREWDSNGTNFGYNPERGHTRGEFGHNDFYPVAVAAAQQRKLNGEQTLAAMILLDEIRGRLAEVFALKDHKVDHVVHGGIASAATYGAVLGATPEQIESAIGILVAHYIPFRAIRAGKQLSDSKGASAAINAEAGVIAMQRAMRGFIGPADIFRNPQAIFCLFEPPAEKDSSPFDLIFSGCGSDFAVMGMHFKLGLYEHQSAGAIQGLINLLEKNPAIVEDADAVKKISITIYEPAFSIIGDPAKRDPRTRQSADHSMVYIIATLLRKAFEQKSCSWKELMLLPADYDDDALVHPTTRQLMERIDFRHGGEEFDSRYPDGIPTTLDIEHAQLGDLSSGLVMYPLGHARNESKQLSDMLAHKFRLLASLGVDDVEALYRRFTGLRKKSAEEISALFDFELKHR
ncbi:MAG: MmgE/PrpD family protein [Pirellulales bacterium]|nr:MmgE/PrpD family protein [Pirellulales bacterium]